MMEDRYEETCHWKPMSRLLAIFSVSYCAQILDAYYPRIETLFMRSLRQYIIFYLQENNI
jgi:hypothetical protein